MPIYYKGAGSGTYWAKTAAHKTGFMSQNQGAGHSVNRMIKHITEGPINSPYISISASYPIAEMYAKSGRVPGKSGIVYEIEIDDPLPMGLTFLDPINEISNYHLRFPEKAPYHHRGDNQFLHGLIDPSTMGHYLTKNVPTPPSTTNSLPKVPPPVTKPMLAIVNALRDSEILVHGAIPASLVTVAHKIN